MRVVYASIRKVAPTESTVFIQGESGTGKELVAEAIHRLSGRTGEFVAVNCGGLTAELVASELFGHERGSFTGAVRSHRGHFERAHQGTLFLDEITEMPLDTQAHLLRVLETGCVQRVGGEDERTVNVRLIAASNRDPGEATRKGLLRQDLYFRLRVFPIRLPPLRERGDDIRLLAEHFLDSLNQSHGTHSTFAAPLMTAMLGHGWPGNVRELRNVVQRLHILADGDRLEGPINPDPVSSRRSPVPVGQSIRTVEKELILSTLEHYQGNRKSTADALGISVKTLYNRLQQYEREGGSEP
jgi:DNA-binding NtrC family response regulator